MQESATWTTGKPTHLKKSEPRGAKDQALVHALGEFAAFLLRQRKQQAHKSQRRQVQHWFQTLGAVDCASICSVCDVSFVKTLLTIGMATKTTKANARKRGCFVVSTPFHDEFQVLELQSCQRTRKSNKTRAASVSTQPREFAIRSVTRTADGDCVHSFHSTTYYDACTEILQNLRLSNSQRCCDTIALSMELMHPKQRMRLWKLLDTVAEGEFLMSKPLSTNVWEETKWFQAQGYYTIAALIVNHIELNVWKVWDQAQRCSIPRAGIASKLVLADELRLTTHAKQKSIVYRVQKQLIECLQGLKKDGGTPRDALGALVEMISQPAVGATVPITIAFQAEMLFSCSFVSTLAAPQASSTMLLVMEFLQDQCSQLLCDRLSTIETQVPTIESTGVQTQSQRRRANRKKMLKQRKQAHEMRLTQQNLLKQTLEELKVCFRKRAAVAKRVRSIVDDIVSQTIDRLPGSQNTRKAVEQPPKKSKKKKKSKKPGVATVAEQAETVSDQALDRPILNYFAYPSPVQPAASLADQCVFQSNGSVASFDASSRFVTGPPPSYTPPSPFFLSFSATDAQRKDRTRTLEDENTSFVSSHEPAEQSCEWYLPSLFSSQSSIHTSSTVSSLDWDFQHWQSRNEHTRTPQRSSHRRPDAKRYTLESFSNILETPTDAKSIDESEAEVEAKEENAKPSDFLYKEGGFFDRQRAQKRRRRPFPFEEDSEGTESPTDEKRLWNDEDEDQQGPCCRNGCKCSGPKASGTTEEITQLQSELKEKAKVFEDFSAKIVKEMTALQQTVNTLAEKLQAVEDGMRQLQQSKQQQDPIVTKSELGRVDEEMPSTSPDFNQSEQSVPESTFTPASSDLDAPIEVPTSVLGPFVSVPMSVLPPRTKLHWDMCEFVSQIQAASNARLSAQMAALRFCTAAVQALWPRAQVRPYGSFVTRLSLPTSDLDLVICLPKVRRDAPAEAAGVLEGRNAIKETWQQHLSRKLRQEPWVLPDTVKTIPHAAIPIITLLTRAPYNVRLDISFEGPGHNGLATNDVVLSLIHEFPPLAPMMLVLKSFAIERGFAIAYSGGLSSYSLLLMVARYLQEHSDATSSGFDTSAGAQSSADFGMMLMGFLDFYGNRFDPRTTGISVASRCFLNRENAFFTREPSPSSSQHYQPPHHPHHHLPHHGLDPHHLDERTTDWESQQHNHMQHSHLLSSPGSRRYGNRTSLHDWPQRPYVLDQMHDPHKFDPIFIEDPLRPTNNVGRNCFRIMQIRRAFAAAHSMLIAAAVAPTIYRENRTSRIAGVGLHPDNILRSILGPKAPVKVRDVASTQRPSAAPSVSTNTVAVPIPMQINTMIYGITNNSYPYYRPYQTTVAPSHFTTGSNGIPETPWYQQTHRGTPVSAAYPTSSLSSSSRRHSECGNEKHAVVCEERWKKERLTSPRLVPHMLRRERSNSPATDKLEDQKTRKCPSRSLSFADVVVGGGRSISTSCQGNERKDVPTSPLALVRPTRFWKDDTAIEDYNTTERLETKDDSELK